MSWYAKERAAERIAALAGRGLDLPTLWRESTDSLATAVPHYMSPCWYTLDPASLLVTSHFQEELLELPPEWLAHEYYKEDFHSIASVSPSRTTNASSNSVSSSSGVRAPSLMEGAKLARRASPGHSTNLVFPGGTERTSMHP